MSSNPPKLPVLEQCRRDDIDLADVTAIRDAAAFVDDVNVANGSLVSDADRRRRLRFPVADGEADAIMTFSLLNDSC